MIRFGCQTYPWLASYDQYQGKITQIMDTLKTCGYDGFETNLKFLDEDHYAAFAQKSAQTGLKLAAFGCGLDWLNDEETQEEFETAERVINMAARQKETLLMLSHKPSGNREGDLRAKQRRQIRIVNRIAARAAARGLTCVYHANSFDNAFFVKYADYVHLIELLDTSVIKLAADIGHMAKGGMDVKKTVAEFLPLIEHVHYKDMDERGEWQPMGKGCIDYPYVTEFLRASGYDGWITLEDESEQSIKDPDGVAALNMEYVNKHLK